MALNKPNLQLKLLVMGDSGAGKSNLIMNFTEGKFMDDYVATIGVDFKVRTIEIDGSYIGFWNF